MRACVCPEIYLSNYLMDFDFTKGNVGLLNEYVKIGYLLRVLVAPLLLNSAFSVILSEIQML